MRNAVRLFAAGLLVLTALVAGCGAPTERGAEPTAKGGPTIRAKGKGMEIPPPPPPPPLTRK